MLVHNEYGIIGCKFLLPSQEDVGNLLHDKIPGITGDNSESKKYGEHNSPKMEVLVKHDISGNTLFVIP